MGQKTWLSEYLQQGEKMNDTPLKIRKKLAGLFNQKTPVERLKMCTEMFDMARTLVLASLLKGADKRRELFLRFYGGDFSEKNREKILASIQKFQK